MFVNWAILNLDWSFQAHHCVTLANAIGPFELQSLASLLMKDCQLQNKAVKNLWKKETEIPVA